MASLADNSALIAEKLVAALKYTSEGLADLPVSLPENWLHLVGSASKIKSTVFALPLIVFFPVAELTCWHKSLVDTLPKLVPSLIAFWQCRKSWRRIFCAILAKLIWPQNWDQHRSLPTVLVYMIAKQSDKLPEVFSDADLNRVLRNLILLRLQLWSNVTQELALLTIKRLTKDTQKLDSGSKF